MKKYSEILMGGSGGQGLVFVSSFLAEAAMRAGLNVAQTQSYGIAQRGGYISGEVVISDSEICFQQVTNPNVILALHEAVGKRFDTAKAPVVFDSDLLNRKGQDGWLGIACTSLAQELGAPKSANLIALGAAMHFVPAVGLAGLEAAAKAKFKADIAEVNIKAMRLGFAEAGKLLEQRG